MKKITQGPEAQLPWSWNINEEIGGPEFIDVRGIHVNMFAESNHRFLLHAVNAYPKLIELLKSGRYKCLGEAEKLLKELGEQ